MSLKVFRSILVIAVISIVSSNCKPEFVIDNPYDKVDWKGYGRFKADLHIHTSRSDGHFSPHIVVDRFHDLGFSILAIADHGVVTYPWQEFSTLKPSNRTFRIREREMYYLPDEKIFNYENRDPDSLGMVAIQGNEVSHHHHIGSYFCDHQDLDSILTESETIEAIAAKNGLAVLFHPGAYDGSRRTRPFYPVEWYVNMFQRHDHLIGMEAFCTGLSQQPANINKWDSTLIRLMPDRPVWGFSNEDYHGDYRPGGEVRHIMGRNGNIFLLPELSIEKVRSAMENGVFFIFHAPEGPDGPSPPVINSIKVNSRKGTIDINASNYEYIEWISDGIIVHIGDQVCLSDLPNIGNYIRAVIYESENGALTGTQPFGIQGKRMKKITGFLTAKAELF